MLSTTLTCSILPHTRPATVLKSIRPCCTCRTPVYQKLSRPLSTKHTLSSPQLRQTSLRASEQEEAEAAKARNPLKPEQPKEEPQLGLVGTIITWGFLAVSLRLCEANSSPCQGYCLLY